MDNIQPIPSENDQFTFTYDHYKRMGQAMVDSYSSFPTGLNEYLGKMATQISGPPLIPIVELVFKYTRRSEDDVRASIIQLSARSHEFCILSYFSGVENTDLLISPNDEQWYVVCLSYFYRLAFRAQVDDWLKNIPKQKFDDKKKSDFLITSDKNICLTSLALLKIGLVDSGKISRKTLIDGKTPFRKEIEQLIEGLRKQS